MSAGLAGKQTRLTTPVRMEKEGERERETGSGEIKKSKMGGWVGKANNEPMLLPVCVFGRRCLKFTPIVFLRVYDPRGGFITRVAILATGAVIS